MTLDEAINHCYEAAKRLKGNHMQDCQCAEGHLQLAHWLEELKDRRKNVK